MSSNKRAKICSTDKPNKKSRGPGKKNDNGQTSAIPRKTWSEEEVTQIAEFIVQCGGKIVPRATLIRKMKLVLNWTVSHIQLGNKWDQLHKLYTDTNRWRNETGQGVKETEGEQSFRAALLKRCPQFEILDSVLGTRAAVNAPAFTDSGVQEFDANELFDQFDANQDDSFDPGEIEENNASPDVESGSTEAVNESEIAVAAATFRASLKKDQKQPQLPKSGQDRIAQAYQRKAEVEESKLQLLREEFKFKKNLEQNKLNLHEYELQQKCNNDQLQTSINYKLEVAKLTKDPQLLNHLVDECLQMKNTVAPPPAIIPETGRATVDLGSDPPI